jgi:hypothetical protein
MFINCLPRFLKDLDQDEEQEILQCGRPRTSTLPANIQSRYLEPKKPPPPAVEEEVKQGPLEA